MRNNYFRHNTQAEQQRGFSLIEVLVALSIFTIVVTMSVGTLLVLIDANGKSQNIQQSINNVSFALDAMVRDIRTGYHYYCDDRGQLNSALGDNTLKQDCENGANGIVFTETGGSLTGAAGGRMGFRHNVEDDKGFIERRLNNDAWQRFTPPEFDIDVFDIVVTGTNTADDVSPLVTIYIEGQVGDIETTRSRFVLQTTVTQQSLDL